MVTEFLHRIKDIFIDYFGMCNVKTIKDNFVIVYELLDEGRDIVYELMSLNLKWKTARGRATLRTPVL